MVIYLITNLINDKKYIGQTIQNPEKRWKEHKHLSSSNPKLYFHKALRKHGIDNFKFEVIDESASDRNELNDLEEFYIGFYNTFKGSGYNCTSGGDTCVISDETKQKLSENMKGKYVGELNPFFGKKHSPETIKILSNSHKSENLSKVTRQKMSDSQRNRKDMSKNVVQCDLKGNIIVKFLSVEEAYRITKVTASNISRVCNNIRKTAGGFIWRYV